jgi:hypothetical protein
MSCRIDGATSESATNPVGAAGVVACAGAGTARVAMAVRVTASARTLRVKIGIPPV